MSNLPDKVSSLIETQFPAFYRDEGERFVAFVKAYYEWLEETDNINYLSRKLIDYRDIDKTIDEFLIHFKNKYLVDFPLTSFANTKSIVKKSLDIYRSKGSEAAVKLVMRLLYGEEATIYHPGDDVIKPSDGQYVIPRYLELAANDRSFTFKGLEIIGVSSGAKAFVDQVARRYYNGFPIDQVFLSNVRGTFSPGETVTANGTVEGNPVVLGSLTSLEIVNESSDFVVGEEVKLISDLRGRHGKARITEVGFATGQITFTIDDSGFGYVKRVRDGSGTILEAGSTVYVANNMFAISNTTNRVTKTFDASVDVANTADFITIPNPLTIKSFNALNDVSNTADTISISNNPFVNGDVVVYTVDTGNTVLTNLAQGGDYYVVYANSTVLALAHGPNGANINLTAGSNENGHTLTRTYANTEFIDGDTVLYFTTRSNTAISGLSNNTVYYVVNANTTGFKLANTATGSALNLTSSSSNETHYLVGPRNRNLGQFKVRERVAQYKTNYYVTVGNLWGNGTPANGSLVIGGNATHDIANGYVVSTTSNNLILISDSSAFNTNASVVSLRASNSSGSNTFANTPWSNADLTVYGYITGVNTTHFGVHTITGNGTFVYYYANTGVENNFVVGLTSNTVTQLGRKYNGSDANFAIGEIQTIDRIFVRTDMIGGNNAANVPYLSMRIDASNISPAGQYSFPKFPAGNSSTIIDKCLAGTTVNVGSIAVLSEINRGEDYNIDPFVLVYEPRTAGYGKKDLLLNLQSISKPFSVGEKLTISSGSITNVAITDGGSGFTNNDPVTFTNSPGVGAYAKVITHANGTISAVNVVSGGFGYTSDVNATIESSLGSSPATFGTITRTTNTSIVGEVKAFSYDSGTGVGTMSMKRLKFNLPIANGTSIVGFTTEAAAVVNSFTVATNTQPIGLNAEIIANTSIANGTIVAADVIDSGLGYQQDELVTIQPSGEDRFVGVGRVNVERQGTGTGFFKNTQGFLNADKYIHDNNYYQEYSYEVRTGISLDKYARVLKEVLHVAGTKYFGNVIKVIADIKEQSNVSQSAIALKRYFYSNSTSVDAALDFINIGNNQHANSSLIFASNDSCVYVRETGNTADIGLVNNYVYTVVLANTSGVKLANSTSNVDLSVSGNETGHSIIRFE